MRDHYGMSTGIVRTFSARDSGLENWERVLELAQSNLDSHEGKPRPSDTK